MIKLYRISITKHINDLTGTGARIYGGRWNHAGYPIIYTSCSRSLAALEFLVHVPMALAPRNLSIAEINIPGGIKTQQINKNELPTNWRSYPPPEQLAEIGTDWLRDKFSLLLEIPSAIVKEEMNMLINPLHNDINLVKIEKIEEFSFDSRLFK